MEKLTQEKIKEITRYCRVMNPRETINQLNLNPTKFMCWGATRFTIDNKKNPRMLRFSVSGMKHKGYVYIFLNGIDMYDVYITKYNGTIVDKTDDTGLFFDQLTDWIDDRIEKIEKYAW